MRDGTGGAGKRRRRDVERPLRPFLPVIRKRVHEPHRAFAQEHSHEHGLHAERVDLERHVVDFLAHHARQTRNGGALKVRDGHAARPGLH